MTYKRILVPVDGSRASNRGLREAIRLAKGQKAGLQLVHVVDEHTVLVSGAEVGPYMVNLMLELRKRGRQVLRSAEALVRRHGLKCTGVLLEAQAAPAADLIVRTAPVPVMLVRAPAA
ncbi:MAG TPA: universal stress protein [Burkholderiales bacterium]|nr:universal stress protein [Burkholderiales bacterium]